MPRSTQITGELILKAALDILISDGFSSVNIRSIAGRLKCSTQPIAWQYKNMDSMRKSLAIEAVKLASDSLTPDSTDPVKAFWQVGTAYIDLGFDKPNLFRFVYMGESLEYCRGGIDSILTDRGNAVLLSGLQKELSISSESASKIFSRLMIYTHGLVSLVVAGVLKSTREEVRGEVLEFARDLLVQFGITKDVDFE